MDNEHPYTPPMEMSEDRNSHSLLEYALFEAEYVGNMVDKLIHITTVKDGDAQGKAVTEESGGVDEEGNVITNILTPISDHDYSTALPATAFSDFVELTPVGNIERSSTVPQLLNCVDIEGEDANYIAENGIETSLVESIIGNNTICIPHDNTAEMTCKQPVTERPQQPSNMNVANFGSYSIEPISGNVEHTQQGVLSFGTDVTSFMDPECSVDSGIEITSPGFLDDLNSIASPPATVPPMVVKPKSKTTGGRNSPETVLPPCRICGGKPSGIHYGAVTCEACKGFFRRSLRKKTVKFKCICNNEKKKKQKDKRTKQEDPCQACRYNRCLAAGMSTNAIKIGRYTLDRKTQNILEVKKLERKQLQSNGDKPSTTTCQNSTSSSIYDKPVLKLSEDASTADGPPLVASYYTADSAVHDDAIRAPTVGHMSKMMDGALAASAETVIVYSGPLEEITPEDMTEADEVDFTVDEMNEIVKTLVEKQYCLMEPWLKESQIKDIKEQQVKYFEQYQLKKQMFGNMANLSKEEYFNFYNSTGIDIDNRQELVKEGLAFFQRKIISLVEFAKAIPDFKDISLPDQANLIKSSRLDSQMIGTANRVFQSDFGITTTPWGKCYHLDEIGKVFPVEFVLLKLKLVKKVKNLALTSEEEAIIRAMAVASADRCDLEEPDKVYPIQYKMLKCLMHVLKKREGNPNIWLSKIMDILISLRTLSETEAKILKDLCLEWPMFSNHTFVRDFIT